MARFPYKDGDEVVFLEAGETTDLALVQHLDGIEKLAEIEQLLSNELARSRVGIPKPEKGQVCIRPLTKGKKFSSLIFTFFLSLH